MVIRPCVAFATILGMLLHASPTYAQGKLAIIIDDIGYNQTLGRRSVDLAGNFTIAVLPFTPHGAELAERARQRGKEIMLHAPMSNEHNYPLGPGGLTPTMQRDEFLSVLRHNLANIPYVRGVNNHMGSLLTQQAEPMRWLMQELKTRHLYFVDSRTTTKTQALITAENLQLPSRRRDVFLDDVRDSLHIQQQLLLALRKAQTQGSAIAIGHPYPETLLALESITPLLAEHRVDLVSVSALMPTSTHQNPLQTATNLNIAVHHCAAPPSELWPVIHLPIDPFDISNITNGFVPH